MDVTTLKLRKPLHKWHALEPIGTGLGSEIRLADDVKEWLDIRDPSGYLLWYQTEEHDFGDGLRKYLIVYLDIDDDDIAMLFKLTWM